MGSQANQRLTFENRDKTKRRSTQTLEQATAQHRQDNEPALIEDAPRDFLPIHNSF